MMTTRPLWFIVVSWVALSLIHWLRDQRTAPNEWLAAIVADQTLTEPVRRRALQFAR